MLKLYAAAAIAGLGFVCACCATEKTPPPSGGSEPSSSAQSMNYKCEGCGKTETVAAGAPAPSC